MANSFSRSNTRRRKWRTQKKRIMQTRSKKERKKDDKPEGSVLMLIGVFLGAIAVTVLFYRMAQEYSQLATASAVVACFLLASPLLIRKLLVLMRLLIVIRTDDDCLSNLKMRMLKSLAKGVSETFAIGPRGGKIFLPGCQVTFPPGAVEKETKIKLSISLGNEENFPIEDIPIIPVLKCEPSMTFHRQVTVIMETQIAKRHKVPVKLQTKNEDTNTWHAVKEDLVLTGNKIRFELSHFCKDASAKTCKFVATCPKECNPPHSTKNDIFIKTDGSQVISYFCSYEVELQKFREEMASSWVRFDIPVKHINAKLCDKIKVELSFQQPDSTKLIPKSSTFEVRHLRPPGKWLQFMTEPPLDKKMKTTIKICYSARVVNSGKREQRLSLTMDWPIEAKLGQKSVAVEGRVNIGNDGYGQNININNINMGNGNINYAEDGRKEQTPQSIGRWSCIGFGAGFLIVLILIFRSL